MSREVIVLGAGMVGVSVAWHLQERGYRVTLVDRQLPGRETSFGNAGIIQREAVRPYPFPRDLATLLRVLPNRQVDIRYRPGGLLQAAGPLFRYWMNSAPSRYAQIVPAYAALIIRSMDAHASMIKQVQAEDLIRKEGYFEIFRTAKAMDAECRRAEGDRDHYGVEYRVLNSAALAEAEPNFAPGLAGAIHWTQPWTVVDPGALVAAYAEGFVARGGRFVQATLQGLSRQGPQWQIATDSESLSAELVVMAMGPWSASWLATQGISVPLFVKRGYHMHYSTRGAAKLNHWVMDAEVGYLMAPMRAGIRLTTGAELSGQESSPRYQQLAAAEAVARQLFPLGERLDAEPWKGGRPCTPDMKPVIGPAPGQPGLWLGFGHGHQGFTMGPITGKLLGQMIDGETPEVDMAPYRAERF